MTADTAEISEEPFIIDSEETVEALDALLQDENLTEAEYRQNVYKPVKEYLDASIFTDVVLIVLNDQGEYEARTDLTLSETETPVARYYRGKLTPFGSLQAQVNFIASLKKAKERKVSKPKSDAGYTAPQLEQRIKELTQTSRGEKILFQGVEYTTADPYQNGLPYIITTHMKPDASMGISRDGEFSCLEWTIKKWNFDAVENWVREERYKEITGDNDFAVLVSKLRSCAVDIRADKPGTKKKKDHGKWSVMPATDDSGVIFDDVPLSAVTRVDGEGNVVFDEDEIRVLGYAAHIRPSTRDGAVPLEELRQDGVDKNIPWVGSGDKTANMAYVGGSTLPETVQKLMDGSKPVQELVDQYTLYFALQSVNRRVKTDNRTLLAYYDFSIHNDGATDYLRRTLVTDKPFQKKAQDVIEAMDTTLVEWLAKK